MNYATIKNCDIANGPGVRVSVFVSGCTRRCKDCFNREAWDFQYGAPFTQETIDQILAYLKPDYICGITVLGGEPFEPQNQPGVLELLRLFDDVDDSLVADNSLIREFIGGGIYTD